MAPLPVTKTIVTPLLWPIKDWPNPQPHQPTPISNSPLFPPRQQCLCHTCIYNQPHFLSHCPKFPSSHLPLYASSHPLLCVLDRVGEGVDVTERSQDNAGSLYGDNQNRGSSGYRLRRGERQRRESGWVRHPTVESFVSQKFR